MGEGDADGVGVGVGPGLAPSPWHPVRIVSDSTAKTAANEILFKWVITPWVDKLSATAEAQSDAIAGALATYEMSSLRTKVGCCWIYLVLTSQAGVLTSEVFSCSQRDLVGNKLRLKTLGTHK